MTTLDRTDLRSAIRSATTPTARREVMVRAREAGLMHLVPEPWRAAAIDAYLDGPALVAAADPADEHADEFKDYSSGARKKMAGKGQALPGGSFPIKNEADLKRAVKAYGRSKPGDRAKVRRHIMSKARGMGRSDLIPESWKRSSASLEETLAERAAAFNTGHPDLPSITHNLLRTVFLRGVQSQLSAASTTTLTSKQIGLARVNTFLRMAAGDPSASRTDADLLVTSRA